MPRKNNRQTPTKLPRTKGGSYREMMRAQKLIRNGNYRTDDSLSGFLMVN